MPPSSTGARVAATVFSLAGLVSLAPAHAETRSVAHQEQQQQQPEPTQSGVEQGTRAAVDRPGEQPGFYGRLGIGIDWPESSRYNDANCSSTAPPALFGCVDGNDGRPLGAYGNFDATPVLDAGLGYRINGWLRAEALLSWRTNMDFSGQSNFLGRAGSNQRVSGMVSSMAGLGIAYVDLPRVGKVRPFLGAGLGVARNRMGMMTYAFPNLDPTATTTTPAGSNIDFAFLLTAGVSVPLSNRFDLDLAYRYSDLGQVSTDSGTATVVRGGEPKSVDIGGTEARLQSHGVVLSLRYTF